ncbi:hypothetical protein [Campylobacter corcagiensis]|uniref:Uncharacterized protein n=1 Tax=Campylobacter corcagiensis TaxID=1448857 RepID=A0A7M1LH44_9BACT|nr:hypothetical protein [Campylobacter corcagiensis]QKF64689.1 putative membrane protein [Campylobacter corcagiensis]QOQ87146.1 hypothetical protein IMC76_08015 [Campylobacter corcagiensis]
MKTLLKFLIILLSLTTLTYANICEVRKKNLATNNDIKIDFSAGSIALTSIGDDYYSLNGNVYKKLASQSSTDIYDEDGPNEGYKILDNGDTIHLYSKSCSTPITCIPESGPYSSRKYRCGVHYENSQYDKQRLTLNISSYTYQIFKKVTCPKNGEVFNPEIKQCVSCPENTYFDPYTKTCEAQIERPDWCPEPMIYKERSGDWKTEGKRTIKECLPDPSINEDECEKRGMRYHGPCHDGFSGPELNACMRYPTGCYSNETVDRFNAERQLDNDLFVWGGFMFPLPIDAIKNGWSSLSSFMKGLFKSPNPKIPNPNLLEYRPQIVDMRATKNGPEPVFDFKPTSDFDIATNHLFKQGEKFNKLDLSNLPKVVDKTPQKLVDVSPDLKKFDFPNDASISKMKNNQLVASKLAQTNKPIPTKEATQLHLNKEVKLEYDFNSMLKDNPTPNLPMVIKQTAKNGNKTNYKGVITTPDNSIINVSVVETITGNGSKVQEVDLEYDYDSPKGKKKFNTGYINTINVNNEVTNTISKPSTVTDVETGSTTTNNPTNPLPAPQTSPDLQSLLDSMNRANAKLDALNKTANKIHEQQLTEWNYNPGYNFSTALQNFKDAMKLANVSFNDGMNFLNGLKNTINDLMNQFNEMLHLFESGIDSPEIPRGTCPFTISGPAPGSETKNIFEIDPCRLVRPYTSILTIFFTVWLSFEVFIFALKYLFNVGGK